MFYTGLSKIHALIYYHLAILSFRVSQNYILILYIKENHRNCIVVCNSFIVWVLGRVEKNALKNVKKMLKFFFV